VVSPQSFNQNGWKNLRHSEARAPTWLTGVVFGPQVRVSLAELRASIPNRYPIRHYPDITHSRQCQYPVPDWDVAYAVTEAASDQSTAAGRGKHLQIACTLYDRFIAYSEGCNDDVNKSSGVRSAGPGRQGRRHSPRIRPVFHWRAVGRQFSRRGFWRSSATGKGRSQSTAASRLLSSSFKRWSVRQHRRCWRPGVSSRCSTVLTTTHTRAAV